MASVVLNHTVVTIWSQDSGNEHSSIIALSSSSNFTSIAVNWEIKVLKTFKWSTIFVPSFIYKLYNCLFKKILFDKFFVIYRLSTLVHKPVFVVSSMMLNNTSSSRHKRTILRALASRSYQSSSNMLVSFFDLPSKAFGNPFCTRISCILSFHRKKLFLPLNFSISKLELWTISINKNYHPKPLAVKTKPF